MKVYVMVSRCGTALGEVICSGNYLEVYDEMKKQYEDALKDEMAIEHSSCDDFEAYIATGEDWSEWFISEHEVLEEK